MLIQLLLPIAISQILVYDVVRGTGRRPFCAGTLVYVWNVDNIGHVKAPAPSFEDVPYTSIGSLQFFGAGGTLQGINVKSFVFIRGYYPLSAIFFEGKFYKAL